MEALSSCCGARAKTLKAGPKNFLDPDFRFQDDAGDDRQPLSTRGSRSASTSGRSRLADAVSDAPDDADPRPTLEKAGRLTALGFGGAFVPSTSTSGADHLAVVQGSSRGIGLEFVRQLLERRDLRGRSGAPTTPSPSVHGDRLAILQLDVTDEDSIEAAAAAVREQFGRVDLLLNCSGVLHIPGRVAPETSVAAITEASALLTYRVNALGPILVAKAFAPLLAATAAQRAGGGAGAGGGGGAGGKPREQQQPTLVVNLSARLSSIRENKLGGWYSYRASKAALNMLTKSLAVEFAKEGKAVACLLLHPGTVATDLSRPFNRNVPPKMLFTPETSVRCMLDIIGKATMADTGKLFTWDGSTIDW